MYKKVCNNPSERASISVPWVYWDGAFSDEELEEMCKYFSETGVERGTTVGHYDKETKEFIQKPNEEVRMSKDRKSTRLNSSHIPLSRMPSSA